MFVPTPGQRVRALILTVTAGLILCLIVLSGCGGSSHTTPVPNPTPIPSPSPSPTASPSPVPTPVITFFSQPVPDATEGVEYTYTVGATTSGTGSITYSLTTAPENATITGNVIAWMPQPEQSRVQNAFIVTATTPIGGIATQEWTVSPAGTIHGTGIVTYHTEAGPENVPLDFSAPDGGDSPIIAVVRLEDGTYQSIQGTGDAEGQFTIPAVPAGAYWLIYSLGFLQGDILQTSSSHVDIGYDLLGRPDYTWTTAAVGNTVLDVQLSNLSPWQAEDEYLIFSPNVDTYSEWLFPDTTGLIGLTSINANTPWDSWPMMDVSQGDKTHIAQLSDVTALATPVGDSDMLRSLVGYVGPLDVTVVDGGSNTVNAPLTAVTASDTLDLEVKGSDFDSLSTAINPNAVSDSSELSVDVVPFGIDNGIVGSTGKLITYAPSAPIIADQVLAAVPYGDPFPQSWTKVLRYTHRYAVPYTAPGATDTAYYYPTLYQERTTMPSADDPIQPVLGPVTLPTVNGVDFFAGQEISTPEVLVSWQPPAIGTATNYRVTIVPIRENNGSTEYRDWYSFGTTQTSIYIPLGSFGPGGAGGACFLRITAENVPGVDSESEPYRMTGPIAYSDVVSAVLTFPAPQGFVSGSGKRWGLSRPVSPRNVTSGVKRARQDSQPRLLHDRALLPVPGKASAR